MINYAIYWPACLPACVYVFKLNTSSSSESSDWQAGKMCCVLFNLVSLLLLLLLLLFLLVYAAALRYVLSTRLALLAYLVVVVSLCVCVSFVGFYWYKYPEPIEWERLVACISRVRPHCVSTTHFPYPRTSRILLLDPPFVFIYFLIIKYLIHLFVHPHFCSCCRPLLKKNPNLRVIYNRQLQ